YDAAKAVPGDIYRYVGSGGSVDLSSEDYTGGNWAQVGSGELSAQDYNNDNLWKQVNVVESPATVLAYVVDSGIDAAGDLTQKPVLSETIQATAVAGSVALSGGETGAGALSGAGVSTQNLIATDVKAYVDGDGNGDGLGDGNTTITAKSASLTAKDTSSV